MSDKPTDEQLIDLMIDLMVELSTMEQSIRDMRKRLEMISRRMLKGGK